MSEKTGKSLTANQLHHCLKRNFGGTIDVSKIITKFLKNISAILLETEALASGDVSG